MLCLMQSMALASIPSKPFALATYPMTLSITLSALSSDNSLARSSTNCEHGSATLDDLASKAVGSDGPASAICLSSGHLVLYRRDER